MEWVETTGRSVIEAKDAALDQLGVDEQDAEIHILEEPQKGLFGRLRVEARVRARVRPTAPRAKMERRDRGRRKNRERRRKGPSQPASNRSTRAKAPAAETKPADRSRAATASADARGSRQGLKESGKAETVGAAETSSGGSGRTSSRKRRRRKSNTQGNGSQQGANVAGNESIEGTSSTDEPRGDRPELDIEAQRTAIEDFLSGLLTAFGRSDAEVLTKASDESTIVAEVTGDELGLLVGPRGQTLQALHELTRSMVQRQFVGVSHARLHLDVAGYRQRRTEALERFARKVAAEVVESGRSKALEPMPANDRKVIHDVVNTLEGVRTLSEGEEPRRRVVIEED